MNMEFMEFSAKTVNDAVTGCIPGYEYGRSH